jgi:hypothetical protein
MMSGMSERASPFARDRWWLLANGLGAMAYLWLSSRTWIEPELRGENVGRAGDAVVWFGTALPVFIGFVVANFVWFLRGARRGQRRQPMMLAAILWMAVIGMDRLLS